MMIADPRPKGSFVTKLIAQRMAQLTLKPKEGEKQTIASMLAAVAGIMKPGKLAGLHLEASMWVDEQIKSVKACRDNPYGDDNEAIAKAILDRLHQKQIEKLRAQYKQEAPNGTAY